MTESSSDTDSVRLKMNKLSKVALTEDEIESKMQTIMNNLQV